MNFDDAFLKLIDTEKGFVNHPNDKGKATKYGITIKTLSLWRGKDCSIEDVKNLSLAEAKKIYKSWYWDKVQADKIKLYSVAFALFDQAVNAGAVTSIKRSQKVLGVIQDGVMGPKTLQFLNSANPASFLNSFINETKKYYEIIANNEPNDPDQAFFKGWINRANDLAKYASENISINNKSAPIAGAVILIAVFFLILISSRKKLA